MPKSRGRKRKNPNKQVIKEPQFLIQDYKGQPMKVSNPNYGKLKTIIHAPQQPPKNKLDDNTIGGYQGLGNE